MLAKRWIITECAKEQREDLSQALGVSEYIAEILLKRGIDSFAAAQEFLNPSLTNLSEPMEILNMGAAAEKIWQAIDDKRKSVFMAITMWTGCAPAQFFTRD